MLQDKIALADKEVRSIPEIIEALGMVDNHIRHAEYSLDDWTELRRLSQELSRHAAWMWQCCS